MSSKSAIDRRLRRQGLPLLLLAITVLMAASLAFRIKSVRHHNLEVATEGARDIFRMIVLTRQWNAEHGGVYVLATDQSPLNPYLDHPERELELPDHRKLVMLNPAYMTRQLAELAESDAGLHLRLHITSLNPIRPANSPDAWETQALKRFADGQPEMVGVEADGEQHYLRYMAPLMVKPACMSCHARQGYKVGDVRGGISVSLQLEEVEKVIHNEIRATLISHGVSYILLIAISCGLIELLARRWRALDDSIETLRATRDQLIETEKMASLGRLVAGFAHEINTPMGIAVGAVSHGDETIDQLQALLVKDEVTEQELMQQLGYLREGHHLALTNLRRAADLVQRFKRTSIDRGSQQKREYQLAELIQDVLTALHNMLKHTAIKVSVACPDNLSVYGIPGLLEQILTNLITNSIHYGFDNGKQPGQISIQCRSDDQRLIMDYRDDGAGMSEPVRQKAFEPFFTTGRERGGSGLGLYVAYNIVTQQMAGVIQLDSSPGAGVHFHIEWPVVVSPYTEHDS